MDGPEVPGFLGSWVPMAFLGIFFPEIYRNIPKNILPRKFLWPKSGTQEPRNSGIKKSRQNEHSIKQSTMSKRANEPTLPPAKKKRPLHETDHEYEQFGVLLDLITTAAGSPEVIAILTGKARTVGRPTSQSPDGVYFVATRSSRDDPVPSGHFKSVRNGVIFDSYAQGFQRPGSNGFCQTFAMMNYLDQADECVAGSQVESGKAALRWLAKNSKALIRVFNRLAKDSIYDWVNSTAKELAGELLSLANYEHFAELLQKELRFF